MKTRITFVSNSSSSSFCIFGAMVDRTEYELCLNTGLETYSETGEHGLYVVGKSPSDIRDDETLDQFKQRIVDELLKLGVSVDKKEINFIFDEYAN